jgi:small GTP-binding protein
VVYGKYNHGKSTFLNAWLKQNELFKTSDKRETVKNQEYIDKVNNIIWIDTPGLDADSQDDAVAQEAVKEADIILLVHDIISGELDKKELHFIEISSTANKQKIQLLLTKIDQNEEQLPKIIKQIESQVSKFKINLFPISPVRYQKYTQSSSEIWKQKSGFNELEIVIQQAISNRELLRKNEIKHLCDDLIQVIAGNKITTNEAIEVGTQQIKIKQNDFNRAAQNIF